MPYGGNYFYHRPKPKSEWDPAKKFKMPKFASEDPWQCLTAEWQCPLCDKMIPFEEIHIDNCPFLTLENKIPDVSI